MQVWNIGSINRDHVYAVDRLAQPGETVASRSLSQFAGGKGYNQSVALARAGARVTHVGCIGTDALDLRIALEREGVDCRHISTSHTPSGHAIIQVSPTGENCILVHGGANRSITNEAIDAALDESRPGDILLVQNETSGVNHAIRTGRAKGLFVVVNPAPFDDQVCRYPLDQVDLLILNQTEAAALCGRADPQASCDQLLRTYPRARLVLTLGGDGALYGEGQIRLHQPAFPATVVDSTAAGDTFCGFFLASWMQDRDAAEALRRGCAAAALCVAASGAAASIPTRNQLPNA